MGSDAIRLAHAADGEDKMAKESIQKKLERDRPPRVHIEYDVKVGDAIERKELPFVVGVLADFAGDPEEGQKPEEIQTLKERKFVETTGNTFDSVLAGMKPHLKMEVENKLGGGPPGEKLQLHVRPRSLADFSADGVANQIEPLKQLLALRRQLASLRDILNERSDSILLEAIQHTEKRARLKKEVGLEESEQGGTR